MTYWNEVDDTNKQAFGLITMLMIYNEIHTAQRNGTDMQSKLNEWIRIADMGIILGGGNQLAPYYSTLPTNNHTLHLLHSSIRKELINTIDYLHSLSPTDSNNTSNTLYEKSSQVHSNTHSADSDITTPEYPADSDITTPEYPAYKRKKLLQDNDDSDTNNSSINSCSKSSNSSDSSNINSSSSNTCISKDCNGCDNGMSRKYGNNIPTCRLTGKA